MCTRKVLKCLSYERLLRRRCVSNSCRLMENEKNVNVKTPLKRLVSESSNYSEREVIDPELEWATSPYSYIPIDIEGERNQKVNPRDTSVMMFPGQGSQYVGMGKHLDKYPVARELYQLSSQVLGWNVWSVCTKGPPEELNRRCQVAVLVTSLAALERLKEERANTLESCAAVAGFSLGEITALIFAGAIPFEQGLRLVEVRTAAMEAACAQHPSGMLTVMYGADAKLSEAMASAREHCRKSGTSEPYCQVANYLYPHCKVIAGSEEALKYLEANGRNFGIRRTSRVKVSGAFHTPLMRVCVEPLKEALRLCDISNPRVAVISNVDARPYRDRKHIIHQLPKQVMCPVRWEQSLHAMFARPDGTGFPRVVTLGPSAQMRTILRQVNAKAWDNSIQIDT